MFNHEPVNYPCPFCILLSGDDSGVTTRKDIVRREALATALISPHWWPKNPGHVLVIPNEHYENLYDLPDEYGHAIHDLTKAIAIAMRSSYGCDGISTRQHNEPSGYQTVWHHHVHVFPRYHGDALYRTPPPYGFVPAEKRWPYAELLAQHLK